jgi:hypothetical protein
MPPRRSRDAVIDLEQSDGSEADSYDSADDSEGSLREFVVDDENDDGGLLEVDDEEELAGPETETDESEHDDDVAVPVRRRRSQRARRATTNRYVLPEDMDADDTGDEDYDPAADGAVCAVFEIGGPSGRLSRLDDCAQRFLEE